MRKAAQLTAGNLIQPLFVHNGARDEPIGSMPGMTRLSRDSLVREVERARSLGVFGIALFPKVEDNLKSNDGREAWNPEGLIPSVVRELKQSVPGIHIVCDVALDPYSSMGQDGIVNERNEVDNDLTVAALVKQAAAQVEAGADIIAPSDMMDGRVLALRHAIQGKAKIMSYSAKYATSYYGPFREALDSAPVAGMDKKTYQMNPGNSDEATREAFADVREGADIIMVKPGLPYLDILANLSQLGVPLAVYHVSGEYAMLKAGAAAGTIDERTEVLRAMNAFRRAGADYILTYYASHIAENWI
ncbi:Delta-aminolevulinic acid dehydratase [Diplonema papillatum]|nr:Delta-aminolevulinic acid dehydratase [Diplonema papillatum]